MFIINNYFFSNNLILEIKNKLIKISILSVALYGLETWTPGKNEGSEMHLQHRPGEEY
jgi:hypothetical protein